jgi:diguanylate cyclase (GGDEF)-like protein/PAS domain S-box-containing protein
VSAPQPTPGLSPERADAARRTIDALASGQDVFEEFFDNVLVGLALADLSTRYIRVNATYAGLLGRAPEDLVGVAFPDVVRSDGGPGLAARLADLLAGLEPTLSAEERYVAPDGRESWVLHAVTIVRDERQEPAWFAVSAQDVSERRRAEQGLRDLTATLAERAVRDPLTGLANRVLLEERLRGTLARDARNGSATSVLFLDLDGFKAINDKHGHAVGDQVLQEVAHRLTAAVRPSDTVSRLGGDEFVVLAEATAEHESELLAKRLADTVTQPIAVGSLLATVGVSVGVSVSHRGEADPASLLAEADKSMYAIKHARRRQR